MAKREAGGQAESEDEDEQEDKQEEKNKQRIGKNASGNLFNATFFVQNPSGD